MIDGMVVGTTTDKKEMKKKKEMYTYIHTYTRINTQIREEKKFVLNGASTKSLTIWTM